MIMFPQTAAKATAKTTPTPAETPMNGAETHQP